MRIFAVGSRKGAVSWNEDYYLESLFIEMSAPAREPWVETTRVFPIIHLGSGRLPQGSRELKHDEFIAEKGARRVGSRKGAVSWNNLCRPTGGRILVGSRKGAVSWNGLHSWKLCE